MEILDVISYVPKFLTQKFVEWITNSGFTVTERWVGTLFIFLCILLVYVGIRISKPLAKWILIILGIFLAIGLLIPIW